MYSYTITRQKGFGSSIQKLKAERIGVVWMRVGDHIHASHPDYYLKKNLVLKTFGERGGGAEWTSEEHWYMCANI